MAYYTQIDILIQQMVSTFYYIGFWHRGVKPTARELKMKFFYCIYHLVFFVSLVVGAIISEDKDQAIYLMEVSIGSFGLDVKLWFLIWKQEQILDFLNRICVFSIRHEEDAHTFQCKMKRFQKFVIIFSILAFVGCIEVLLIPLIVSEKNLVFEIGFPLDYKDNEVSFWIANIFIFTESILELIIVFFNKIICYLLFVCTLRYELLGNDLEKTGRNSDASNDEISEKQKQIIFVQDLEASVNAHLYLRGLINELESFLSNIFLFLFGSSGMCICGSVYCLAFDVGDDLSKRCMHLLMLYYFMSDLFMNTYFGNEIMLSSNRISYSLFKSDWVEQPQSTKKNIIIFGEYLKQPQELVIGKLYPLTLETFKRILNSAYSMFNILKNFKK